MGLGRIVGVVGLVSGGLLGACGAESWEAEEPLAGETLGEKNWQALRSSIVSRQPQVRVNVSALDSQNALPSGLLSDDTALLLLRAVAGGPLQEDAPAVMALRTARDIQGATLLKYLARCALGPESPWWPGDPPGGRLGLAPDWRMRALNAKEQRWITACLMAHTNNFAKVNIALSGTLPTALGAAVPGPAQHFPIEEAAFYGNVFLDRPEMFACGGVGAQRLCSDAGIEAALKRRICGRGSTSCGFTYTGPCNPLTSEAGVARPAVCAPELPYARCSHPLGEPYTEIVTVSLQTEAELLELQPHCWPRATPSCGAPAHDACSLGAPLSEACNERVCEGDPYCCKSAWDSSCVERARDAGLCP